MRATDAKIRRILEKDYSASRIKQGQEWYVGKGRFLECGETKDHLLYIMDFLKEAVKSAQTLRNVIDGELGTYRISNNLYGNVLDLGEHLAVIELFAEEYIKAYNRTDIPDDELRKGLLEWEEEAEPSFVVAEDYDNDELPF